MCTRQHIRMYEYSRYTAFLRSVYGDTTVRDDNACVWFRLTFRFVSKPPGPLNVFICLPYEVLKALGRPKCLQATRNENIKNTI